MLTILARNWWMVALRGVAAVTFGITAMIWPGITLGVLIAFFGAYAIFDGGFSIASAFSGPNKDRFWYLIAGLAGIGIGITAWAWPGLTALALLWMIASWAIIIGALQIAAAITLRDRLTREWLLILSGIISILFGLTLAAFPGDGAVALVTTIGFFSMLYGGSLIGFAWRLRGMDHRQSTSGSGLGAAIGH